MRLLIGSAFSALACALGCSEGGPELRLPGGTIPEPGLITQTALDDAPFAAKRAACTFKQGALPSETFGASISGIDIPIDTVVIVSQENHSFDEYLGQLPAAGQPGANVERPSVTLSNDAGQTFSPYHESAFCLMDAAHDWDSLHRDWDGGRNDGFVKVNGSSANPSLGYYDARDLSFYYALATTYGVGDAYFSAVLGPTVPNRLYLYAGTSAGHIANGTSLPPSQPTIFQRLRAANVSFGVYSNGPTAQSGHPPPTCGGPYSFESAMFCEETGPAKTFADFQRDAAAGALPHVVWAFVGDDEHPPTDVEVGQANVQTFFDALAQSQQWARSAFILTYDESGGFYDHVPPPPACAPDDVPPAIPAEGTFAAGFDVHGFRVPFIIASPYSRPHYVSHVVNSHTSILRFLELRFALPACSARDANADPLLEFFDFTRPSFATPSLPAPVIVANPSARGC
jgi:phospholipase C